jgi:tetratricopeptide (TPR) repeat protein
VETQVLAGEPGAYRLTQDLPSIQVPPTVQAILAARIDRLPPDEKSLLQTASVIGNEVPLTLLQAIAEMSNEALHPCLMHLQSAEFLYETSLFPERVYTFKHALTHEVAYGSLLQERRRVLHAHIVEEMERLAGDQLAEQVERLAHHAFRGEAWDKALVYFRQAGFKAMERSAYREAMAYFEPALRVLQHLPESRATLEYGIDLRLNIRYALFLLGELEPILGFLQEAETLAERLGTPRRLCEVASRLCHHLVMLGVPDRARYYGERALTIAQAHSDMAGKDAAYRQLGVAYLSIGDYQRTIDFLRPIVAASERETLFSLYSSHALAAISPRVWSIWALTEIGIFAEGMAYGQEALRIGEASDDPYSILNACFGIGYLYLHKGELSPAISILEKGVELCDIWDIQIPFPLVASQLGAAYTLAGRLDNAIPLLELAIARATSFHVPWYQARRLVWLSEALLLAGRTEEATAIAERAIDFAHTHKECGNEAHALRLQGDITMHRNPLDIKQAETHYQQALALANELGMRPLQAHCHRGLGKLYRQTGQAEPARAELTTAIEMYRDMEMTFWLPETEAALAEVEGQ